MHKDTTYAYLAGLADGDGCFKAQPGGSNGRGRSLHLEIGSRYEPSIDWLIYNFGGNKTITTTAQGRPFYRWKGGPNWLREHLPYFVQYLIEKKTQAEVVLQLLELKAQSSTHARFEPELQDELLAKLVQLKKDK